MQLWTRPHKKYEVTGKSCSNTGHEGTRTARTDTAPLFLTWTLCECSGSRPGRFTFTDRDFRRLC